MNIEVTQKYNNSIDNSQNAQPSKTNVKEGDAKFSEELKNIKKNESAENNENTNENSPKDTNIGIKELNAEEKENAKNVENEQTEYSEAGKNNMNGAIDGLQDVFTEINKLNRTNEKDTDLLKLKTIFDDDKDNQEDVGLIDNNMNIQEPKEKINLQMGGNMNFTGDGQPFAEFVNPQKEKDVLKSSAKDLAEEKAIMSTMEENVAIANKNMALNKTKTVENEHGIKKVDKNTNVTVDTIVSYDRVIMDKSDVDFFVNLVENSEININDVQHASKSSAVSKTLADMLAKSMQDNKPIRIDFDNDISVIIKIGRDGKISADFLPSSQIAEAYLKENLPILKQRFDDNNIEYGELNQRKQKQDEQENRKKGRKDE